jgi:hypothetical protein
MCRRTRRFALAFRLAQGGALTAYSAPEEAGSKVKFQDVPNA